MKNILVVTLLLSAFLSALPPVHGQQACVSTISVPLRVSFCPTVLGTVTFTILDNGRLQIRVILASGTAATIPTQGIRIFVGTDNPSSDPSSSSFVKVSAGTPFTTTNVICGTTVKIAVAVLLRNVDGDTCTAWAVPASGNLPSGVRFQTFVTRGFAGFFTISFCPCTCCNANNFVFTCPTCTDPKGKKGPNCPPTGPLTQCPRNTPSSSCYCGNSDAGVTCFTDLGSCTGAKKCGKKGECPSGSICQRKSCCNGDDICVPPCAPKIPCQQP